MYADDDYRKDFAMTDDLTARISRAHVGQRTVDQTSQELTRDDARVTYLHLDSRHRRVSRTVTDTSVTYYWIDRADGNLPGVGTHFRLTVPAIWVTDLEA